MKATARTSTSDSGSGATRRVLVAAQFAIAVVLVAGAGLLIQTLANLQSVDLCFQTRNVLALRAELPQPRYSEPQTRETFYREALARVRALPGVAAAGFSSYLPLAGPGALLSFTPEGRIAFLH